MCFYMIVPKPFGGLKGPKGVIFFCLGNFFLSITLQSLQTSSILSWTITIGLVIFGLPPFQDTPPITTVTLLQTFGF
jgi:hypothetical protein